MQSIAHDCPHHNEDFKILGFNGEEVPINYTNCQVSTLLQAIVKYPAVYRAKDTAKGHVMLLYYIGCAVYMCCV